MDVKLRVTNKNSPLREIQLGAHTLVGRSAECHLRVVSMKVSRRHCELHVEGESIFVRDLGSSNGTKLNGRRIPTQTDVAIAPGSRLQVGPLDCTVEFAPSTPRLGGQLSTASDSDILAALPQALDNEETRDYLPRDGAAVAERAPRGALPPSPAPPAGAPIRPGDTVVDAGAARHAREAAERARERAESVLEGDSSVDLPTASQYASEGSALAHDGPAQPKAAEQKRRSLWSVMPRLDEIVELPQGSGAESSSEPEETDPLDLPDRLEEGSSDEVLLEEASASEPLQTPEQQAAPSEVPDEADPALKAFLEQFRPQP
jgi:predicted component of type VI protein secretion system